MFYAAAKKKKKKGQVLSLGEFLGEEAGNVVTTSSSWADEVEQHADGLYQFNDFQPHRNVSDLNS